MRKSQHGFTLILFIILFSIVVVGIFLGYKSLSSRNTNVPPDAPNQKVTFIEPPCGSDAKKIQLGSPYMNGPLAYFSTDGSELYITARKFEHGGYFDPEVGITAIYIGEEAKTPVFDEQRGSVSNTIAELNIKENKYSRVDLPKGRYWLWTSRGGDAEIASCGSISN